MSKKFGIIKGEYNVICVGRAIQQSSPEQITKVFMEQSFLKTEINVPRFSHYSNTYQKPQ